MLLDFQRYVMSGEFRLKAEARTDRKRFGYATLILDFYCRLT